MIKLIVRVFYINVLVVMKLSAMCDDQSREYFNNKKKEVDIIKSLSREDFTKVTGIIKNLSHENFPIVEEYLYLQVPRLMQMEEGNDKQKFQKLLSEIMLAQEERIDPVIFDTHYKVVTKNELNDSFIPTCHLVLTEKERLMFYCGGLPGERPLDIEIENREENRIEAVRLDAIRAVKKSNIPRLRVLLEHYESFLKGFGELFPLLCGLEDCSDLVINYMSLPGRGVDMALEFARSYDNQSLVNDLVIWMSKQEKN